jgi:hypothetical protein
MRLVRFVPLLLIPSAIALACGSDDNKRRARDDGLNLNDNQLTSLGFAQNMTALETLFVSDNPLDCGGQAANIAALTTRGVSLSSDCP